MSPARPIPNPNPDELHELDDPELDRVARALGMSSEPEPELPRARPDVALAAIAEARALVTAATGAGSGVGRRPARRVLPTDGSDVSAEANR